MMRIGLLKLTDAAPVIMAKELGLFEQQGADVSLSIEPSWANIADKLTHGFLDAAVIVPPLAFAMTSGLRGIARPLIVPMTLSLGGNTIALGRSLARHIEGGNGGTLDHVRTLASVIADFSEKPAFAVVHVYSTHNLLLRYWLAAGGIDPDKDISLVVVPPSQTVEALASGRIAGFCAGAPWGAVAEAREVGSTIATSQEIWRNGPEKVFAVREDWAIAQADELQAVLRALLLSARYCDDPANADAVACTMAAPDYLGVESSTIRRSLPGCGDASSAFFRHAATYPWLSHAEWFLAQMRRWNLIGDVAIESVYRPDLYAIAAVATNTAIPHQPFKTEGHSATWLMPANPAPIVMQPDGFFDQPVPGN